MPMGPRKKEAHVDQPEGLPARGNKPNTEGQTPGDVTYRDSKINGTPRSRERVER
jgi:hypothetical protein